MSKKEKNIIRRRLVRSYVASVVSIALVLTLAGAIALFWAAAGGVASYFKENMTVSVIFRAEVEEDAARAYTERLASREDVKDARFVSREEGENELKQLLGEDFLSVFETTPVPLSADIHLSSDAVSSESLSALRAELEKDPIVGEVSYQESMVEALNANLTRVSIVLSVVVVVLLIISSALITNTVRLNLHARRFTILTMRQVGARDSFIRRPFMRQAMLQGAVSGFVAALVLLAGILYIKNGHPLVYAMLSIERLVPVLALLIPTGMLVCYISAFRVVTRIIHADKDEFYY